MFSEWMHYGASSLARDVTLCKTVYKRFKAVALDSAFNFRRAESTPMVAQYLLDLETWRIRSPTEGKYALL